MKKKSVEIPSLPTVRKNNELIHCYPEKLSLFQRKSITVMTYLVKKAGFDQTNYSIGMGDFLKLTSTDTRNYQRIKTSLKELTKFGIEWGNRYAQNWDEEWGVSVFLSLCRIKKNVITFELPHGLKEMMRERKIYTNLKLDIFRLFKSKYSLTLYELCKMYETCINFTGFKSVSEWKYLLGIPEDDETYSDYKEFNRSILQPSIKEVNTSDIIIIPMYKKVGRKISEIKFVVQKQPEFPNDIVPIPDEKVFEKRYLKRDELQVQYNEWTDKKYTEYHNKISAREKRELEQEFLDNDLTTKRPMFKQWYEQEGFLHPQIIRMFRIFLKKKLDFPTFEQWLESNKGIKMEDIR